MKFEESSSLTRYLVKNLEPLTEADPVILAQYVIALLKKDKPIKELESLCSEDLVEFLGQDAKPFIRKLFQALEDGSIVAPANGLESLDAVHSSLLLITEDLIEVETSSSKPGGGSPYGRENGMGEKEASDDDDDDLNHKHRREETHPPSFDNNVQGEFSTRPNRKHNKPFENGQMLQRGDPQLCKKWKQYNSAPLERHPFDKRSLGFAPLPRDIGLWTRGNQTFHGNPGSHTDYLGRGGSSGPWSHHDLKFRTGNPLDFSLQMASAGSIPGLFAGRGLHTFGLIPAMPNGGVDALDSVDLRGTLGPTSNQSFGIGIPRQHCRDFEERGFCLRGDLCPMEHGVNRIVVDDVQSLTQFNLPVSLPSGCFSGVTEGIGPLSLGSAPSSLLINNKSLLHNNRNSGTTDNGLGLRGVSFGSTALGEPDFYDPDQPLWINERPETYNVLFSANVDCTEPLCNTNPSNIYHCELYDGINSVGASRGIAPVVGPQNTGSCVWGRIGNSGSKLDKTGNLGSTIISMSSASIKTQEDQEDILSTIPGITNRKKQIISKDVATKAINSPATQNTRRPFQKALRTLHVSGIPLKGNLKEALLSHFHKFGVVIGIYIPCNSGAFVQFSTREEAEAALKAPDAVMGNRFIKLSWAKWDRILDNGTSGTATAPQDHADTHVPPQPPVTDNIKEGPPSAQKLGSAPASDIPISAAVQPKPLFISSLKATSSPLKKIESLEILKEEFRLKQEMLDKKRKDFRRQLDRLEKQVLSVNGEAAAGEAVKRRKIVKVSYAITPKSTNSATAGNWLGAEKTRDKSTSVDNTVSPSSRTKSTMVLQSPRSSKQHSQLAMLSTNRFELDKCPTTFGILLPLPADFAKVDMLSEHFSSFGGLSAVELEDPKTFANPVYSELSEYSGARITFTTRGSAERAFLNGKCWRGHSLQFIWLTASSNSIDDYSCKEDIPTPTLVVTSNAEILAEACKSGLPSSSKKKSTLVASTKWSKPEIGYLKLNFDAAWSHATKKGSLGWLIRDDVGNFVAGGANCGLYGSAKEAEARALREGLLFIKDKALSNICCEGDAKNLIDQLASRSIGYETATEILLWDCLNIADDCNMSSFLWVPRTGNGGAHLIARWAKNSTLSSPVIWVSPPPWLGESIRDDADCALLIHPSGLPSSSKKECTSTVSQAATSTGNREAINRKGTEGYLEPMFRVEACASIMPPSPRVSQCPPESDDGFLRLT